ncbi:MAG: isoamylase [Pseudomonadales bacterium]|jgi:glycogen operon protein|nr:isoamylase [Pseudomonadales bacterium]
MKLPFFNQRLTASPGEYRPFGATATPEGVNFAIYSQRAGRVTLLIWEKENALYPTQEFVLSPIENKTSNVWHIFIHGLKPYARYGYRIDGKNEAGDFFDVNKVLLDPYAKATDDGFYDREIACKRGANNLTKSIRGIVLPNNNFDWENDQLPKVPLTKTVIYELHVRGLTRHPSAMQEHAGTFKAMINKLDYFVDLGVTSLELMPILHFDDDIPFSNTRTGDELINYWGYSTLSYFALQPTYFSSGKNSDLDEFKTLVKEAHKRGLEIILDVVYNHTTESGHTGPTLSWRGIDNQTYYLMSPGDKHYYQDYTGCGNTLNTNHSIVGKMIVDSLEYLASEFHVDGFRFDLGAVFYYNKDTTFTTLPEVIKMINDSPILSKLKMTAEPWDASGNVLEGRFGGAHWLEWNGSYRNRLRDFVNFGKEEDMLSQHINGYAPEYIAFDKNPGMSINYVTSHDGFTLRDLVSYNHKHNEENAFDSTDGTDNNRSNNYGAEGETDDENINRIRKEKAKQFLELLFITPGVPMITMGDEMWRTQGGNNNPFCQDNSITWLNWELIGENQEFFDFVKELIWKYRELN